MDLAKLNPPQREAVVHERGPLLVLAGAGSGKTRVITHRIAHLLERGVPPDAIAAMTFTNKAAEEMRERVAKLVRGSVKGLTVGTFHAFGLSMLKKERAALGFPRGFSIYDQSDQLGLVRELLRGGERRFDVKAILTRISLAKNKFTTPTVHDGDEYDEIAAEVFPKYQEALRAQAAVDFDDLICEPVRLLQEHPDVAERWQSRFEHVLVDEYQDTNKVQLLLLESLVARHGNLCVVGDDDQSIYSWRGADPTNILRFADMFEGAKIVKLEQNYRSTRTILDAANAVIANNKLRHGKTLWSDLATGDALVHAVAQDVDIEAKWVAAEIRRLRDDGRPWSDMAILYRSNLQSKLFEEELRQNGVPYVMYGGQQFFERKEVKDVIAYLRAALNPKDELALRRIINYPARGIGATTLGRMVEAAHAAHVPLWEVVQQSDVKSVAPFVAIMERLRERIALGAVAAVRGLIEDIALYDDLRDASPSLAAAQRRIDNVEGLIGTLQRSQDKRPGPEALGDLLRLLSLQTSGEEEDTGDKVVMTTLHGAKGLEFPVVFMVGLEEELLPHARTLNPQVTDVMDADHATDVSEERRLCYVGITRAQQRLYLTRACQRVSRGRSMVRTPSRFLLEIPDELLEVRDLAEEARQVVPDAELRSFFKQFS